jgi:exo-beta-1,3-glucanase (GH17 family)
MKTYGVVRIYGMACDLIPIAVKLAKANNQKIMAGIWLNNNESGEDIETVVKALGKAVQDHANGSWDIVALVSVENERVNDRVFTASHVVDATNKARQALRFAGYNGPVGAVETVPAMLANPAVCEGSDVALVNVHSFFDTNCDAESTGQFVKDQVALVREKCDGKRVVVTEAGWPHTGDSHHNAIPSRQNQKKAIESLLSNFKNDLFLFNAFDSPWKSDWAGTFNSERYWGILE